MDRPLLTRPQTAKRLGVSLATLDRIIARGELSAIQIGARSVRVDPEELDRYIEQARSRRQEASA